MLNGITRRQGTWGCYHPRNTVGITAIADAIRASSSLTAVNLLKNDFDVEVATMLAQISREKKITLCGIMADQTEADFNNRELGPADAILIAASLEFRSCLISINLSHNNIGIEGGTAVAEGIRVSTLCSIDVGNSSIDQATALELLAAMKDKDMVSIGMAGCKLGVEGAKVVAEMAVASPSLMQVPASEVLALIVGR